MLTGYGIYLASDIDPQKGIVVGLTKDRKGRILLEVGQKSLNSQGIMCCCEEKVVRFNVDRLETLIESLVSLANEYKSKDKFADNVELMDSSEPEDDGESVGDTDPIEDTEPVDDTEPIEDTELVEDTEPDDAPEPMNGSEHQNDNKPY